jgi:hypothetical protein
MIHPTTKGLILNPAPPLDGMGGEQAREGMSRSTAAPPGGLERRLRELDREWDVERLTVIMSSLLLLLGLQLVSLRGEQWLAFPAVVAACLLLHGLIGWTPAFPLLRVLGFRTSGEVGRERHSLEAARRDVREASPALTVQDREDLSRFENEGGLPAGQPGAFASGAAAGNDEPEATRC